MPNMRKKFYITGSQKKFFLLPWQKFTEWLYFPLAPPYASITILLQITVCIDLTFGETM